jgi:hypothetical protein
MTQSFPGSRFLCGLLLIGTATIGTAQQAQAPAKPLVDADHKRMMPEQALTGGTVPIFGNQAKEGMYVYRNDFAPGRMSRPHYDGAKDEEAVVQIMGIGPVKTVQTEVDEKGVLV